MSIVQIKSLVQFTRGTSLVWESLSTPIPDGVVSFSIDDGAFKLGDGVTLYTALPTLFTFNDLISAQGGISSMFAAPTLAQNGNIVVVSFDQPSGKMMYKISTTSLASLVASLIALEATNSAQDVAIASLLSLALSIDASINTAADNSIVVINNGRYSNSGITIADATAQIAAANSFNTGSHVQYLQFYSDSNKTKIVDQLKLTDNTTYYVEVVGFNNKAVSPVFDLTCANTKVVVTHIGGSLFSVLFDDVTGPYAVSKIPVVLIGSVDDGTDNARVKKACATLVKRSSILVSIYGSTISTQFNAVVVDSLNNIICVGYTAVYSIQNNYNALIVKFDSNLNVLASKVYSGSSYSQFNGVAVDSNNNIYCAGYTFSQTVGHNRGLVVKFDNNLTILSEKVCSSNHDDMLYGIVVNSSNNVIAVGQSSALTDGIFTALVIKFDSNLTILAQKLFGGTVGNSFNGVAVDSSNNVICVGYTSSEGVGSTDALIVKYDNTLANILDKKVYGGTGADQFVGVTVDIANNIICVGNTDSEGTSGNSALVVKFDNSFNILARKIYGGSGDDDFYNVTTDSLGNVVCIGFTKSEGAGGYGALVVKFDGNLNATLRKIYGGSGDDSFYGVTVDNRDAIVAVGQICSTDPNGVTLAVKLPKATTTGTFVGSLLPSIQMVDSTLTLANSALTLANSTEVGSIAALTISNAALINNNLTMNQVLDTLG